MSIGRIWLVTAFVLFIGGASLFDILAEQEHWPFGPYRMFAGLARPDAVQSLGLIGLTADPEPEEVAVQRSWCLEPLNQGDIQGALNRMRGAAQREQLLDTLLRTCLERYEARRQAGLLDGPPLSAIRLYRFSWKFDSRARNATQRPDRRDLLHEVSWDVAQG